jgi:hypothetical protein
MMDMNATWKLGAFAALLAAAAHAATFNDTFMTYSALAGGIIASALGVAAIIYMVGSMLAQDKLKAWAKIEVVEIAYSAFLLGIALSAVLLLNDLAGAYSAAVDPMGANVLCTASTPVVFNYFSFEGKPVDEMNAVANYAEVPCHMRLAKNFFSSLFYEQAYLVKNVGVFLSWQTLLSSLGIDFSYTGNTRFLGGGGINLAFFSFLNSNNNGLNFIFENGVKMLIVIRFQEVLLNVITTAIFPFTLATGLVLRCFSATRKLGGLLIAMAFMLFYVYPMFYVFGDGVYNYLYLRETGMTPSAGTPRHALVDIPMDLAQFEDANPRAPETLAPLEPPQEDPAVNTDVDILAVEQALGTLSDPGLCERIEAGTQSGQVLGEGGTKTLSGEWLSRKMTAGMNHVEGVTNGYASIDRGIDALAKITFFTMFFSVFALYSTIAGIKSLSPMLGGDTEIAGLTHLI